MRQRNFMATTPDSQPATHVTSASATTDASRSPLRQAAFPISLVMLVVWAVWTFVFEAPGWVHILLTGGVFLLIWAIVASGDPPAPKA